MRLSCISPLARHDIALWHDVAWSPFPFDLFSVPPTVAQYDKTIGLWSEVERVQNILLK